MANLFQRAKFSGNPLVQLFTVVASVLLAIGAILLGAVMLSLLLGVVAVIGFCFYLRLWWLRKRWTKKTYHSSSREEGFVEGEYQVLQERSSQDRQ